MDTPIANENPITEFHIDDQLGNSTVQAKHKIRRAFTLWNNIYPIYNLPEIPTVCVYSVLRDNNWVSIPTLLIAKNDLFRLENGQTAPCTSSLLPNNSNINLPQYKLESGQKFFLSNLYSNINITSDSFNALDYANPTFLALETPLQAHLDQVYYNTNHLRKSVFENQMAFVIKKIFYYFIPLVICLIFIHSIVYLIIDSKNNSPYGPELFLYKISLLIYPIGLAFPTIYLFKLISTTFGNCKIITLSNVLQQSKTDYEDLDFIDEFDADAPPPTKDVKVSFFQVLKKMIWIAKNSDYKNLSRFSNLIENLGSITTFCCVDQEGTISHTEPEELVIPSNNSSEKLLALEIEKSYDSKFAYTLSDDINGQPYSSHVDLLKPIANLFAQHSFCNHFLNDSKLSENHSRICYSNKSVSIPQTLDFCLCTLGKYIGVQNRNSSNNKHLNQNIAQVQSRNQSQILPLKQNFSKLPLSSNLLFLSTNHPSYKSFKSRKQNNLLLMETSLHVNNNSINASKNDLSSNNTIGDSGLIDINCYSSGNFDLILSLCSTYWNGKSISTINNETIAELFEFFESAKVQDLRCVAYSTKSISIDNNALPIFSNLFNISSTTNNLNQNIPYKNRAVRLDLNWGNPSHLKLDDPALSNQISTNSSKNNEYIGNDSSSNIQQHLISVKSNVDNFDSSSRERSSQKINEPSFLSQENNPRHQSQFPFYFHNQFKMDRLNSVIENQIRSNPSSNADYSREYLQSLSVDSFCNEIADDQLFLGLVTFCHNPKTDVCDFIEDLSLAGIRFVYFSQENGQTSKAFAERLGLETDWNTCILLSSEQQFNAEFAHASFAENIDQSSCISESKYQSSISENGSEIIDVENNINVENNDNNFYGDGGYHEDYEIKAQLPRGIDEIKEHLEQVDDIPLQVSLFAECTSTTTSQMINIFSDYGEIVCVVGSMLLQSNTTIFLNSHLSFAIDPLCHRYTYNANTLASISCIDSLLNLVAMNDGTTNYTNKSKKSNSSTNNPISGNYNTFNNPNNIKISKNDTDNQTTHKFLAGESISNDGIDASNSNFTNSEIPTSHHKPSYNQLFDVASALNSLCCPIFLLHDTSFYTVLQLASESRRLLGSFRQGLLFIGGCYLSAFFINFVCILSVLPPALDYFATFWYLCVFAPVIAFTYSFVSPDPNCMSQMTSKNNSHVRDFKRFCIYSLLRLFPIVLSTTLSYILALLGTCNLNSQNSCTLYGDNILSKYFIFHEILRTPPANQEEIVAIPQMLASLVFLFNLILFGATMMHRVDKINIKTLFLNVQFVLFSVGFAIISAAAITLITFFSYYSDGSNNSIDAGSIVVGLSTVSQKMWNAIPFYSYIIGFVLPIFLLVPVQEMCKSHDRRRYLRYQKIAKLEFNTKLGLHSPL
ncbi:hypothetical protein AYI69_g7924 [Smittium culicis]|uniref:Transmembrane protein n=1 Tax=Smittium culicis TaxID=133412 RepID=A0A1R1XNJ2_9FUNG|nr:hypothetical protein AYI69_g7924 [Smittium culicis]